MDLCAAERDWPKIVTVLGASVPVSAVGAILFTTGAVSLRTAGRPDSPSPGEPAAEEPAAA